MAGPIQTLPTTAPAPKRARRATEENARAKWTLIAITVGFFIAFLILPLITVFFEALRKGVDVYFEAFRDEASLHAVKLTLIAAAIAVPANTIFGLAAAWSIARFEFRGKQLLISLIDLPLWVSPVIAGLMYVLLFGAHGSLGPWLQEHGIKIIFSTPGIIIATIFVTFPFVARGLIPLMQQQGIAEEEAAITLGARGWQIFRRVTLPKIKWALIYGIILTNARAMGEFGAVSVVSGHIRNQTNTIPLQIEILYNDYQFTASFALASLLSILALITLGIKGYVEWRARRQLLQGQQ